MKYYYYLTKGDSSLWLRRYKYRLPKIDFYIEVPKKLVLFITYNYNLKFKKGADFDLINLTDWLQE